MEDFVLYNPKLRVYKDGHIEKYFQRQLDKEGINRRINKWVKIEYKPTPDGYIKIVVERKDIEIRFKLKRLFDSTFKIKNLSSPPTCSSHFFKSYFLWLQKGC